ncbi:MAG TPA: hypothetical protein VIL84_00290 [Devosiaceae bacterium]
MPRSEIRIFLNYLPKASAFVVTNQAYNSAGNFLLTVWLIHRLGLTSFGFYVIYYLSGQSLMTLISALFVAPAASIAAMHDYLGRVQILVTAGLLAVLTLIVFLPLALAGSVAVSQLLSIEISGPVLYLITVSLTATEVARRLLIYLDARFHIWALDLSRFGLLAGLLLWEVASASTASFERLLVIVAASNIVTLAVLSIWRLKRVRVALSPTAFLDHAKRLLVTGKWLSISALMQVINDNIFLFVGSALLGGQAVGVLRASQSVVGLVNPLLLALENIIPRWLGEQARIGGKSQAMTAYWQVGSAIALVFTILLVVIAGFAGPFLARIAGPGAAPYVWVMQIICLTYMTGVLTVLVGFAFRTYEKTRPMALSLFCSSLFAACAAWPLVYFLGLPGLMLGILTSGTVRLVTLVLQRRILLTEGAH